MIIEEPEETGRTTPYKQRVRNNPILNMITQSRTPPSSR